MTASDAMRLIWLVPLFPAVGAAVLLVFGKRIGEPVSGWIATLLAALSFVATCVVFIGLWRVPPEQRSLVRNMYTWIHTGGFRVDMGFLVDPLSVTMLLFVTGVGTLIHLDSVGYMHGDARYSRFFAYLNLFLASMIVLVSGSSFLVTFLGWEGVGLCSYLLISFWFERNSAAVAGKKAFVTNRIGDVGFLLAMFLFFSKMGTLNYSALAHVGRLSSGTITAIALLLFLGAVGKSAQIPLHVWLPDAMEGPTPVSALIHAATMVTAGVFLVVRTNALFDASSTAAHTVAWVGGITALFAATVAVVQNDIKRVLAYSTISQLGYMFMAAGVGAYSFAIFHMVTHAFFKALLFLGSGSVIHGMHDEQDMRNMGGLRKWMPVTAMTFIVGWLAIAGIFPLSGFWSKDQVLGAAFFTHNYALWVIGIVTALLTAFYMTRQVRLVFYGDERWRAQQDHSEPVAVGDVDDDSGEAPLSTPEPIHGEGGAPHESPPVMTGPLVVLAVLAAVAGVLNLPLVNRGWDFLSRWLEPVTGRQVATIEPSTFVAGTVLALVALAVAVLAILYGISLYRDGLRADGTDPTVERLGRFEPVLANAWYVNAAYAWLVDKPGRAVATWLSDVFDRGVIDGAVNGIGRLARDGGQGLRVVQTGRVRTYALSIMAGAVLLLLFVSTRVV
jgi:NADH-quinone oxidoreductase subunit L